MDEVTWGWGGRGVRRPHLVSVHSGEEEGEGYDGGCHGVGRRHSVLINHPLLQLHHWRGEGAGPLQDVLGHLADVHHQLKNQRTGVSPTKQVRPSECAKKPGSFAAKSVADGTMATPQNPGQFSNQTAFIFKF